VIMLAFLAAVGLSHFEDKPTAAKNANIIT